MLLSIVPTARLVTPGYFTNSHLIEIIVSVHLFLEVKKKNHRVWKDSSIADWEFNFRSQLHPGIVLRRQIQIVLLWFLLGENLWYNIKEGSYLFCICLIFVFLMVLIENCLDRSVFPSHSCIVEEALLWCAYVIWFAWEVLITETDI